MEPFRQNLEVVSLHKMLLEPPLESFTMFGETDISSLLFLPITMISSMQRKICSLRPFCLSASLIAPMHTKVQSLSAKVVTGKNDRETIRIQLEFTLFYVDK